MSSSSITFKPTPPVYEQPNNRIDWKGKFTAIKPEWYQNYTATRVAGAILAGVAITLAAITVGAAFSFTAEPIVVIVVVGGLALSTVAALAMSVYCLTKHCWNDPEYLRMHGKKNEEEALKKSYSSINKEAIRAHIPYNDDDYNRIFRDRIFSDMSYTSLRELLGNFRFASRDEYKTEIVYLSFNLDPVNKAEMKKKLFNHMRQNSYNAIGPDEQSLLTDVEYNDIFKERIFDDKYSYLQLKALLGNFAFPLNQDHWNKVRQKLCNYMTQVSFDSLDSHEKTVFGLEDIDYNAAFKVRIFDEKLSYVQLKQILGNFAFTLNEENKEKLREKLTLYIKNHNTYALSDKEKALFEIGDGDLGMLICMPRVNELLENKITYEQFISQVKDNVKYFGAEYSYFNPAILDEIRDKAIASYIQNNEGVASAVKRQDAQILNIDVETLVQAGALNKDLGKMNYELFRIKHSEEAICHMKSPEIDQLQQVFENEDYPILRRYITDASLFGLKGHVLLENRVDKEMGTIRTLEELMDKLGSSVFTDNLLKKEDPRVKKLVLQFVKESSYHIDPKATVIKYDLLTEEVTRPVEQALQSEKALDKRYQEEVEQENNQFESNIRDLSFKHDNAIKNQYDHVMVQYNRVKDQLENKKVSLNNFTHALGQNQSFIRLHDQLNEKLKSAKEKKLELEKQIATKPDLGSKLATKGQIAILIKELERVPALKEELSQLDKEIPELQKKPKTATGLKEALKSFTSNTEQELKKKVTRKNELNTEIPRIEALGSLSELEAKHGNLKAFKEEYEKERREHEEYTKMVKAIKALEEQIGKDERQLAGLLSKPALQQEIERIMRDQRVVELEIHQLENGIKRYDLQSKEIKKSIEDQTSKKREQIEKAHQKKLRDLDDARKAKMQEIRESFLKALI